MIPEFEVQTLLMTHNYLATAVKDEELAIFTLPENCLLSSFTCCYFKESGVLYKDVGGNVKDLPLDDYIIRPMVIADIYRQCRMFGYNKDYICYYDRKKIYVPLNNPEDVLSPPSKREEREKEKILLILLKQFVNGKFQGSVIDLQIARERKIEEGYLQVKLLYENED